jgi:ActR/RegA family two-component response regulator
MEAVPETAANPKILLVDDNDAVRDSLRTVLEFSQFEVKTAANVAEAIHLIDTEAFDVLLSDLHLPGAGDGFTIVSAMRHRHPDAVTLLFTGYPALKEAMDAILLQADEIMVKPMPIPELLALIREKLKNRGTRRTSNTERVASILEREAQTTIADWLSRVERDDELKGPEANSETTATLVVGERPGPGPPQHGHHRQPGGFVLQQVSLQLLAARNCNPRWRYGRQPKNRGRSELPSLHLDPVLPQLSFKPWQRN